MREQASPWPGGQGGRASSAQLEHRVPAIQDAAWAADGLCFHTQTHDGSLGGPERRLSPTLSFSAQTDLSPGQGSPRPPWGDSQYLTAVKGPRWPTGLSLHLTTGAPAHTRRPEHFLTPHL